MDIKRAREDLRKGKTIYDMPLRVVYYARVSTDKDDQLNSLENQQNYFEEMITENKNWVFAGGYIDEGISGTAVKNRDKFLKMIEDATLGKIDMIVTKEISRFSRNTVDSIKYTEYLLKQGVIVYFLSDNLNTIQEDSEFRLTIMSSLAQDEVRKLSERVKFGVNRMIKDRKLIGGNLTGYFKKNGKYEINPAEAPIIKYLFETYASGKVGLKKIGQDLAKMGYLNSKGEPYSQTTMAKFLTNPRYKGFYTARLTEVENYKTHKKKKVPKERQIIERDERVPAIVSEELWDKANELHEMRKKSPARNILNSEKSLENAKYSCLLYCKDCGCVFIRAGGSNRANNPTWSCKKYKTEGVGACASPILREDYLDKIFVQIFSDFIDNKKEYLNSVIAEYENIIKSNKGSSDVESINGQITNIEKQKDKLLDLSIKGLIDDIEFKKRNDKFNNDIHSLKSKIERLNNPNSETNKLKERITEVRNTLTSKVDLQSQLPNLMRILVERVEVEKINGDRKHVKLIIYFNFNANTIYKELEIDNTRKKLELSNFYPEKCSHTDIEIQNSEDKNTNINCGTLENKGKNGLLCSNEDTKQSWVLYQHTYKFIENPLNNIRSTKILEVKTTYDLAYDGVSYTTELNTESPKEVSTFVLNHIKSSKKNFK